MSDLLKAFYIAYLAWIDAGAIEKGSIFQRSCGLCSNLSWYAGDHGINYKIVNESSDEMLSQFMESGLNSDYPFNDCNANTDYWQDSDARIHHLNPKRIQWVRDQVAKIKKEVSS